MDVAEYNSRFCDVLLEKMTEANKKPSRKELHALVDEVGATLDLEEEENDDE